MRARQWLLAAAIAAVVGGIAFYASRPMTPEQNTMTRGPDPLGTGEIITRLPQDAIQAVDHPVFEGASAAQARDGTPVMGVAVGDQAHAYPIAFLSRVEIVNDRLGDKNITVTW